MTAIDANNASPGMDAVASHASAWAALWAQVAAHMHMLGAHPARTVVLLPFFQLQAVARVTARQHWPSGFVPRLETTKSWSQRMGHFMPGALDISFDAGLDSLRAAQWLQRAGWGAKQAMLSNALVQTAHQLGALVAAVPPMQRSDWAARARAQALQGVDKLTGSPLMYEAAIARIALEWAVASRYASDVLFEPALHSSVDALVVVQGLQANPLASALAQHWQAISSTVPWQQEDVTAQVNLHSAANAFDEADRAAACVLQHIAAGRTPVALAAVDRVTTRRVSATLALHGVALQDETGWKLSTTRAAASVMGLLRAARGQSVQMQTAEGAQDALLDWLKHTNAAVASVNALERAFRAQNTSAAQQNNAQAAIEFIVSADQPKATIDTLLGSLRTPRSAAQWLLSLKNVLSATGQWGALMQDAAGRDCVQALHLLQPEALAEHNLPISLNDFSTWASDCLENASFKPSADDAVTQVVVLPLAQVLARPFEAIVIAAADEQRLGASPEPVGHWSAAQREALGLPSRTALAAELQAVWASALSVPQVDVLWRSAEGDQVLQPSPLLQRWLLTHATNDAHEAHASLAAPDPRVSQRVQAAPTAAPQPTAGALRVTSLSASSYSDLRTCPYRFFALRLLGLQEADELNTEINKRDFGSWLHSVLADFHTRRKANPDMTDDATLLDQCAADNRIHDAGFVPFAAAWPQVRSSYLLWLAQHESEGWQFDQSELTRSLAHEGIELKGRLDRVDRLSRGPEAGTAYVLDYKTESTSVSKERVKNPLEDTQLAFYAALLGEDDIHAAYVNVAERSTASTAQPDIMPARDALLTGISTDLQRIHAGQTLPALGEGTACDYCAARGLCRKDMWTL